MLLEHDTDNSRVNKRRMCDTAPSLAVGPYRSVRTGVLCNDSGQPEPRTPVLSAKQNTQVTVIYEEVSPSGHGPQGWHPSGICISFRLLRSQSCLPDTDERKSLSADINTSRTELLPVTAFKRSIKGRARWRLLCSSAKPKPAATTSTTGEVTRARARLAICRARFAAQLRCNRSCRSLTEIRSRREPAASVGAVTATPSPALRPARVSVCVK